MDEHRELWWKSPTVELAKVEHLRLPDGFTTARGACIPSIQVSFESWGVLNERKNNAVLIAHPLTADCHATGSFAGEPPGWWEGVIGPGNSIDTNRYFVVCPNLLGGCYGTTGPRFPAPDGGPYLDRFPLLSPSDMMRVQSLFVKQLGIERLRMVVGPSMGGMIAWEWAIEAGEDLDLAVIVAAPLRTTAYQIGLNWLQRRGIELDLREDPAMADWGRMVARGVGMLSYRSPVGLEEKFGRVWFREPGSVLGERGMFNIESWLRHHGKRIVRRFDPYTYLLFSRAMDLHDIGEGRGGLIAALDRVRCRVLVVGVSSDNLYPPAEVHQGADVLRHLGKPVEYAEIRSPHGHDAVFIETRPIGACIRGLLEREPRIVPTPAEREIRVVRIGILGAGRVASLFARLLADRHEVTRREYGLEFVVAAVADTDPEKRPGPEFEGADFGRDPEALVRRKDIDALVEATSGTDAHRIIEQAIERRLPVVTPNKSLVHEHGARLESLALERGVRLAYQNAISAGWPLLYAIERPLGGIVVSSIEAILSSAAGAALERIESGATFDEATRFLREEGFSEFDPELDTSGWDSAQKLAVLLSRAEEARITASDLFVKGIETIDPVLARAAIPLGLRVRLVAIYRSLAEGLEAGVLPAAVPAEGHLGSVRAEDNVVILRSGEGGEMVYIGKGRGSLPVATAVFNDLVGLFHPSRSWTGQFPRPPRKPAPPRFERHLAMRDGTAFFSDAPAPGSVPVLDSFLASG
ncbi:MAG: homoserine O-acetyltransferase [Candidatus Eisenbacteria bacterium]|nr:homoserine O-acetyltransferase [Candidatus Eisenbacteria bacterium]